MARGRCWSAPARRPSSAGAGSACKAAAAQPIIQSPLAVKGMALRPSEDCCRGLSLALCSPRPQSSTGSSGRVCFVSRGSSSGKPQGFRAGLVAEASGLRPPQAPVHVRANTADGHAHPGQRDCDRGRRSCSPAALPFGGVCTPLRRPLSAAAAPQLDARFFPAPLPYHQRLRGLLDGQLPAAPAPRLLLPRGPRSKPKPPSPQPATAAAVATLASHPSQRDLRSQQQPRSADLPHVVGRSKNLVQAAVRPEINIKNSGDAKNDKASDNSNNEIGMAGPQGHWSRYRAPEVLDGDEEYWEWLFKEQELPESPYGSDVLRALLSVISPKFAVKRPEGYVPVTPSSISSSRYVRSDIWMWSSPSSPVPAPSAVPAPAAVNAAASTLAAAANVAASVRAELSVGSSPQYAPPPAPPSSQRQQPQQQVQGGQGVGFVPSSSSGSPEQRRQRKLSRQAAAAVAVSSSRYPPPSTCLLSCMPPQEQPPPPQQQPLSPLHRPKDAAAVATAAAPPPQRLQSGAMAHVAAASATIAGEDALTTIMLHTSRQHQQQQQPLPSHVVIQGPQQQLQRGSSGETGDPPGVQPLWVRVPPEAWREAAAEAAAAAAAAAATEGVEQAHPLARSKSASASSSSSSGRFGFDESDIPLVDGGWVRGAVQEPGGLRRQRSAGQQQQQPQQVDAPTEMGCPEQSSAVGKSRFYAQQRQQQQQQGQEQEQKQQRQEAPMGAAMRVSSSVGAYVGAAFKPIERQRPSAYQLQHYTRQSSADRPSPSNGVARKSSLPQSPGERPQQPEQCHGNGTQGAIGSGVMNPADAGSAAAANIAAASALAARVSGGAIGEALFRRIDSTTWLKVSKQHLSAAAGQPAGSGRTKGQLPPPPPAPGPQQQQFPPHGWAMERRAVLMQPAPAPAAPRCVLGAGVGVSAAGEMPCSGGGGAAVTACNARSPWGPSRAPLSVHHQANGCGSSGGSNCFMTPQRPLQMGTGSDRGTPATGGSSCGGGGFCTPTLTGSGGLGSGSGSCSGGFGSGGYHSGSSCGFRGPAHCIRARSAGPERPSPVRLPHQVQRQTTMPGSPAPSGTPSSRRTPPPAVPLTWEPPSPQVVPLVLLLSPELRHHPHSHSSQRSPGYSGSSTPSCPGSPSDDGGIGGAGGGGENSCELSTMAAIEALLSLSPRCGGSAAGGSLSPRIVSASTARRRAAPASGTGSTAGNCSPMPGTRKLSEQQQPQQQLTQRPTAPAAGVVQAQSSRGAGPVNPQPPPRPQWPAAAVSTAAAAVRVEKLKSYCSILDVPPQPLAMQPLLPPQQQPRSAQSATPRRGQVVQSASERRNVLVLPYAQQPQSPSAQRTASQPTPWAVRLNIKRNKALPSPLVPRSPPGRNHNPFAVPPPAEPSPLWQHKAPPMPSVQLSQSMRRKALGSPSTGAILGRRRWTVNASGAASGGRAGALSEPGESSLSSAVAAAPMAAGADADSGGTAAANSRSLCGSSDGRTRPSSGSYSSGSCSRAAPSSASTVMMSAVTATAAGPVNSVDSWSTVAASSCASAAVSATASAHSLAADPPAGGVASHEDCACYDSTYGFQRAGSSGAVRAAVAAAAVMPPPLPPQPWPHMVMRAAPPAVSEHSPFTTKRAVDGDGEVDGVRRNLLSSFGHASPTVAVTPAAALAAPAATAAAGGLQGQCVNGIGGSRRSRPSAANSPRAMSRAGFGEPSWPSPLNLPSSELLAVARSGLLNGPAVAAAIVHEDVLPPRPRRRQWEPPPTGAESSAAGVEAVVACGGQQQAAFVGDAALAAAQRITEDGCRMSGGSAVPFAPKPPLAPQPPRRPSIDAGAVPAVDALTPATANEMAAAPAPAPAAAVAAAHAVVTMAVDAVPYGRAVHRRSSGGGAGGAVSRPSSAASLRSETSNGSSGGGSSGHHHHAHHWSYHRNRERALLINGAVAAAAAAAAAAASPGEVPPAAAAAAPPAR